MVMGPKQCKPPNLDFHGISRSHFYWGRKHPTGLARVLHNLKPGEIFVDPFCGGGTPALAALLQGARVIAGDLNPMAVFLSRVLIRPVSIFALRQAFREAGESVAESVLRHYEISCPGCKQRVHFDYLKWNTLDGQEIPEAVKVNCEHCGFSHSARLSSSEIRRQLSNASIRPEFWFPKNAIRAETKNGESFFHRLFTGRNLACLAALNHAIKNIGSEGCREALQYVFTAMLYSCSKMQRFSNKAPSSSQGWTAPGFYVPPTRKEKNVWKAFERRFKIFLNCKEKLNSLFGSVRIADSLAEFESSHSSAYLCQTDYTTFPFAEKSRVAHVFLDPPCRADIDYMGFSEFWGCWLDMAFDLEAGWHPGRLTPEENAEKICDLLLRMKKNTAPGCLITLAHGAKNPRVFKLIVESVKEAGFDLQEASPAWCHAPQKTKKARFPQTGRYFLLTRKSRLTGPVRDGLAESPWEPSNQEQNELKFLLQATANLFGISGPDLIRERVYPLLPSHLIKTWQQLEERKQVEQWTGNESTNLKAYHTLCLSLLEPVLSLDGYKVTAADPSQFVDAEPDGYARTKHLRKPTGAARGAHFTAGDVDGRTLLFCFYEKQTEHLLKEISQRAFRADKNDFKTVWFAVFRSHEEMIKCRAVDKAENWPRGFFLCIGELTQKAIELFKTRFGHLEDLTTKADFRSQKKVKYFKADVIKNDPLSDMEDCIHYKLRFKAPELTYVVPGQFVMLDTMPVKKRRYIEERPSTRAIKRHGYDSALDLTPASFLKRPFSIHRAYYKHFHPEYLKNMSLPPTLATVVHTHFPHEFLIFYKVLKNGIGTNELMRVKAGDKIEMLGPLGRYPTLSDWRGEGIEEVHLVGGGVGMAPLVFFGQALKFYSFKLRAFIGIDRIETLLYSARLAPTFAEDPHNAYAYIDSLLGIGLRPEEIHLSCEIIGVDHEINGRLPKMNHHKGFITEQYESYLKTITKTDGILVVACGPQPMLTSLDRIVSSFNVPMKVLLEKRMACGIGVCLSCVCRTNKEGPQKYARVCTDGPLFDSRDIDWG